ncbi:hypothetical protein ACTO4U_22715, partial [Pseudomonas paraeruginosa]|uniref:hypothetical protein n=1 Tax=Pseudomonas paraeruginosa TaxID=2994495 RepID=UPI003F9085ED
RLRWPKKNSTHCPGWVDHYNSLIFLKQSRALAATDVLRYLTAFNNFPQKSLSPESLQQCPDWRSSLRIRELLVSVLSLKEFRDRLIEAYPGMTTD